LKEESEVKLLPYVCTKQKRNVEVNGDLSDFEITIEGDRQTLYQLFNQENRIKKLERENK